MYKKLWNSLVISVPRRGRQSEKFSFLPAGRLVTDTRVLLTLSRAGISVGHPSLPPLARSRCPSPTVQQRNQPSAVTSSGQVGRQSAGFCLTSLLMTHFD